MIDPSDREMTGLKRLLEEQGRRFAPYRSKLQPAEAGLWKIERFTIGLDLQNLRMIRDGRGCCPGEYTRLVHKRRGIMMSDTDAEIMDFLPFVNRVKGNVLVAGLGMGLVVQSLLAKPDITAIVVVEIDPDVIALTGSQIKDDRLQIIRGDIYKWMPGNGVLFDYAWYDIWDEICGDNAKLMKQIKRRLREHVRKHQACWCERQTIGLDY
jgi:hypothetical protein